MQETSTSITNETAGFRHKTEFKNAPTSRCSTRLRLTPSGPDKSGATWYRKRVPINRGFETLFTFQVFLKFDGCSNSVNFHLQSIQQTKYTHLFRSLICQGSAQLTGMSAFR